MARGFGNLQQQGARLVSAKSEGTEREARGLLVLGSSRKAPPFGEATNTELTHPSYNTFRVLAFTGMRVVRSRRTGHFDLHRKGRRAAREEREAGSLSSAGGAMREGERRGRAAPFARCSALLRGRCWRSLRVAAEASRL